MAAYSDPYLIAGIVTIFFCGFGCGWLARRPKVVYEPRQKRDEKGRWLPMPH